MQEAFLAAETGRNLQAVSLGVLAVCLSKDRIGDPWKHGHCRLTELPIEEYFGSLRVQSTSAQLTARSFWRACARQMLRQQRSDDPKPPTTDPADELEPLTATQFMEARIGVLWGGCVGMFGAFFLLLLILLSICSYSGK